MRRKVALSSATSTCVIVVPSPLQPNLPLSSSTLRTGAYQLHRYLVQAYLCRCAALPTAVLCRRRTRELCYAQGPVGYTRVRTYCISRRIRDSIGYDCERCDTHFNNIYSICHLLPANRWRLFKSALEQIAGAHTC